MSWQGHVFTYGLSLSGTRLVYDPVVEFLSQGVVGGPLNVLDAENRVEGYFAAAFAFPMLGPIIGFSIDGRSMPKPHIVAFYRWLLNSPFTVAGDCTLAAVVERGFVPGSEVFPVSEYALVLERPDNPLEVLYPGVACMCVRSTRRGLDLLVSLARDVLGLDLLSKGSSRELLMNTLLAVLEAVLAKSLQVQANTVSVVAWYTTAVVTPGNVSTVAEQYRSSRIYSKSVSDSLSWLLGNRHLLDYVLGDFTETIAAPSGYDQFVEWLKSGVDQIAMSIANRVRGGTEAVLFDVTGRWSLLELYTAMEVAEKLGSRQVYLLTTPETHINVVAAYLLLDDAHKHNINTNTSIDSQSPEITAKNITISPVAASATDPHIVKAIIEHIIEKHQKKIVHILAHPATASLTTLKIYHENNIPRENIVPYPLKRYKIT